ncbi:NmraA like family protein [Fusarium oxysporum f. sp. phaseoli]
MKVVAVAGGTGSVGSTIVDGLVEYGKHKVYALSRKERSPQGAVNYLKVDYNDPDAITKALEDAGVNILICAISVVSPKANQAQKNLIQAAERSSTTERFVISSFDMLHVKEDIELSPLTRYTFEAIDELEKTSLTYTRIANGWFLDYYACRTGSVISSHGSTSSTWKANGQSFQLMEISRPASSHLRICPDLLRA